MLTTVYKKYFLKTGKVTETEGEGNKRKAISCGGKIYPWSIGKTWVPTSGCHRKRGLVLSSVTSEHCLYVTTLIYTCSFSTGIVEIQTLSSLFILLRTTFGLKILFAIDGERIYIQLSSEWKRRTLGLCGTFNGNIRDDFL